MPVLVEIAFGVTENEISGVDRLGQEHYEISAKPEGGGRLDYERLKPLLRLLLEERFRLVTHRETKDLQGYALVVAKGRRS